MLENFPSHLVREIPLPEASLFWSFVRQAGQCIGQLRESSPPLKTKDATYGRIFYYSYRGSSWYIIPILRLELDAGKPYLEGKGEICICT